MAPPPVFLPGESPGQGSLVGGHLWGRTESDTTEATQQQQQHHLLEVAQAEVSYMYQTKVNRGTQMFYATDFTYF